MPTDFMGTNVATRGYIVNEIGRTERDIVVGRILARDVRERSALQCGLLPQRTATGFQSGPKPLTTNLR
jgi:hypothetical protein